MNSKDLSIDSQPTSAKRWLPWTVWLLRLLVGTVFIMSGIAKCIDIWGFSFKIEEYFIAWGVVLPQTLYVMGAISLSVSEFLLGAVLALGCYRRSVPWLLLLIIAGMLPLSLYIYIANPVADCGCFGDLWVMSNGATFLKNVFLTAAIIYLVKYNRRVAGLYSPYWQWLVGLVCFIFSVIVSLWGYNIQPLFDFRSFPVGTELLKEDGQDVEFEFIYEKDGHQASFTADALPDSTWNFIDRKSLGAELDVSTELVVYDDGEDVTSDVISDDGPQLLIVVPDYRLAGISYTYKVNELSNMMDSIGGSLIEIAAMPKGMIRSWRDMSMAEYPIYQAEPTVLKELVRGGMGAVYMVDGKIIWKRTLLSVDLDKLKSLPDKPEDLSDLAIDGKTVGFRLLAALMMALIVILLADKGVSALKRNKRVRRIKKK